MATIAAVVAAQHTSSYRVKLKREEFLELLEIAKAKDNSPSRKNALRL